MPMNVAAPRLHQLLPILDARWVSEPSRRMPMKVVAPRLHQLWPILDACSVSEPSRRMLMNVVAPLHQISQPQRKTKKKRCITLRRISKLWDDLTGL